MYKCSEQSKYVPFLMNLVKRDLNIDYIDIAVLFDCGETFLEKQAKHINRPKFILLGLTPGLRTKSSQWYSLYML